MKRTQFRLLLLVIVGGACGCSSIVSHGDSLPSAAEQSDADYGDPWHGLGRPLEPVDHGRFVR